MHLRKSSNVWAQAVVHRRSYKLLLETHDFNDDAESDRIDNDLREERIDYFRVKCEGILSKYGDKSDSTYPLMILEPEMGRIRRIQDYTSLYKRFDKVVAVSRVYCEPDQIDKARKIIGK